MRSATNRRLDDLASLLPQVRFSHEHADYKESRAWRVFVYPRKGKGDRFDALVCVIPRKGPDELGAGLLLTIEGGGSFWLAKESTNKKGQVWFRDLPPGEYLPHLGTMPLPSPAGVALNMRAPGSGRRNLNTRGLRAWPSYVLQDRRISAALKVEKSGLAVLTWRALEPALAGVRIAFQIAGETGEVILNPTARSVRPSARWPLRQAYRDIAALLPRFTIKGKRAAPKV
jgi:hypothetical protein